MSLIVCSNIDIDTAPEEARLDARHTQIHAEIYEALHGIAEKHNVLEQYVGFEGLDAVIRDLADDFTILERAAQAEETKR
ncbi:hypothetical protein GS982_01875 [Rhodococcus hoagii]|uniref:Uncharacterized protein n=1 Tax=Rhodococcus hoagii TaxID=43767 RepID=A0A9Q4ZIU8_RHOHA|nr:hypothetical protein [Prescottella equi]NKT77346.1 hypothetical protein [Prescottella equi]NKZ81131.1 hypothetical protein [Prescottella equi]